MNNILIIGASKIVHDLMKIILPFSNMKIIALISDEVSSLTLELARKHQIPVIPTLIEWEQKPVDIVLDTTADNEVSDYLLHSMKNKPVIFSRSLIELLLPFLREQQTQINNLQLILNTIRDGLIVVNRDGIVQLMNSTAKEITEITSDPTGQDIIDIIPNTRLPNILQNQMKEVNKKFTLQNGRKIITTRIPLINEKNHLFGAFAIFKDNNEVIRLAEENTDLKEIKTMLEAIIQSSDEAISVVDERGNGLLINPAYTRITGLSESEVIGKPATVDISEGESIHLQVLQSRRPIRRARLKVGPQKKAVLVNAAPIIVAGKLKGSVAVIHDISEIKQLTSELERAKQIIRNLEATYTFEDIIGNSTEMNIAIEQAKIGANTPATVLLRGKSGTGKELFAHAIHNASDRKYNKFIRVNCAALTESVLESELFGYEGGAFTGAKSDGKKGIFEEANYGSIFLDEIGELPLATQAKLLRVLQEKEIVRVGGTTPIPIDVRIIAATNANLEKRIIKQSFREDLYYRLNRLPIYIPTLHERLADLPELTSHIITKVNQMYGRNVTSISEAALKLLQHYHWPGNIRELENVISRAVIFMDVTEHLIDVHHLPELMGEDKLEQQNVLLENQKNISLQTAVEQYEKAFIRQIYEKNNFNKSKTAKELKISVRNLYYKLDKYRVD